MAACDAVSVLPYCTIWFGLVAYFVEQHIGWILDHIRCVAARHVARGDVGGGPALVEVAPCLENFYNFFENFSKFLQMMNAVAIYIKWLDVFLSPSRFPSKYTRTEVPLLRWHLAEDTC